MSARRGLLFDEKVKVNAHVDACTHECTAYHIAYDGALEAEPRLLKQTRNFIPSRVGAAAEQTVSRRAACGVHCDARGVGALDRRRVTKSAQSDPISVALVAHTIEAVGLGRM
jgi:hypothetical protein